MFAEIRQMNDFLDSLDRIATETNSESGNSSRRYINLPSDEPLTMEKLLWRQRLIDTFKDDRVPAEVVIRAQGNGIVAVGEQYDLPSVPVWRRDKTVIIVTSATIPRV